MQKSNFESFLPTETAEQTGIERKRSLGIYYTPPEAAKILARWTIREPHERVLEPSFGGCSLLAAALTVFKDLGNPTPSKQLYGFDVDPQAFHYLQDLGILNTSKNFFHADFLLNPCEFEPVDAVLANPPFVSYERMRDDQKSAISTIRNKYQGILRTRASLWAYFLLHSLEFLRPGGRMAFILPNAIGSADYSRPIITHLEEKFRSIKMIHLGERLFMYDGVDERISLLLLEGYNGNSSIQSSCKTTITYATDVEEALSVNEKKQTRASGLSLKHSSESAQLLLDQLELSATVPLGLFASVRIGEVIGDMQFFVKSSNDWKDKGISEKHLYHLLTRSSQVSHLFLTKKNLQFIPSLLIPSHKRTKAIDDYLNSYPQSSILNNQTFKKRGKWDTCPYQTDADAFIGSISHDYPRIIGNPAGISCSNAFYKITFFDKSPLIQWLPLLSLTTPFRLSSEVLGRVRGSGGIKLEPSDVSLLCLPAKVPTCDANRLKQLTSTIKTLIQARKVDEATELVDESVYIENGLIEKSKLTQLQALRQHLTARRLKNIHIS